MIATIDLGGTRTKFGLVHEGEILASSQCAADPEGSLEQHLDEVLEHLQALAREHAIDWVNCRGIGILSTGIVNNRDMRVLSTNQKYDDAVDFDFTKWAHKNTGLPLRLENDARGALIGEWRHGAGRGANNLMMVTIGTGIGTAVICNGEPLTGEHFMGGNLGGHLIVNPNGRPCTCGGRGCLESEASGWVLPTLVREHPEYNNSSLHGTENIGYKELLEHADQGDPCAISVRDHCVRTWGQALVSFIHLIDPQRIMIGGGIMHRAELVLESFRQTISELTWGGGDQIELVAAEHPDNAGLIGAAALFHGLTSNH